ncbi:MAG TPA: C4-type zinc ribbon domain-containing protein [Acidimicrobiales bacterium]|nr:C4-type zinc ribbon domain-containing protein [Acidimicrobiales bacterium]
MADLEVLLDLQEHDTTLDQLEHRRTHLPERAELARVDEALRALEASVTETRARHAEAALRLERMEQDLGAVDSRIKEVEARLYGGTVSASRDLQAMSQEVTHLKERRSELEDRALEAMDPVEALVVELDELAGSRASLDAEAMGYRAAIAEAESATLTEAAAVKVERDGLAAGLPGELLAQYEGLRKKLGGVGAARLVGASCSGCHLTLPSGEVDRIRHQPPDVVVLCDSCGRILVR